jgi:hypothetical protein
MSYFAEGLSTEEQNLYNPAYVGTNLYHAVRQCQAKNEIGLHCSLVYLLVPLALSQRYSTILPSTPATPIAGWVVEKEGHLVGFASTVHSYIDIVNSAIAFLMDRQAMSLSDDGYYRVEDDRLAQLPSAVNQNTIFKQAFLSAGLLGRWFAAASSVEAIYTHFGVTP